MIAPEHDHEHSTAATHWPETCFTAVDNQEAIINPTIGTHPAEHGDMGARQQLSGTRRACLSTKGALLSLLSAVPASMAACVPLKGSKACSAWQSSSVSTTDDHVVGLLYVCPALLRRQWFLVGLVARLPTILTVFA
jgi:hypothetical protein